MTITQQLDPNLNWESFRLGDFGFGGQIYTVPANTAFYQTTIDLTATEGYDVDVSANIDELTGIATWIFTTIDPTTGQIPLDPTIGFLPPDNDEGAGEGFVSYTVLASASAPIGTVVSAQATVTFDTQPPINTPQVSNTLDSGAGLTSAVAPLPATQAAPDFPVSWSGSDAANSSAIASYTIYVSDNDGPFTAWLQGTTLTSATFAGQYYHTYRFYSLATDNVGNVQQAKSNPDTSTTLIPAGTPTWLGGGTDNFWSDGSNWSTSAAPSAGAGLVFFGAAQTKTDNDLPAGTSFGSLNLVSPSFVLAGNGVTLASATSAPVVNLAATSGTIQLPITLGSNATFAVTDVPGSLTVSGNINNGGYGLTVDTGSTQSSTLSGSVSGTGSFVKTGSGRVVLSGANSFSGGAAVVGGTLVLAAADALPAGSSLTVGSFPLIVTPTDWTSAGLTLELGSDDDLHVYKTGTTNDVVAPQALASVPNIQITSPSKGGDNLTIDSTNGSPIPAGGLIKTGPGKVVLNAPTALPAAFRFTPVPWRSARRAHCRPAAA